MFTCMYKSKRINAINIVDENDYLYIKEIKLAGAQKQLICEDDECKSPMILKKGQYRNPHFAHWKGYGEECPYNEYSKKDTADDKKCKELLNKYFKNLYPKARIELEYKAVAKRRSDIYIEFDTNTKLTVDITRYISPTEWLEKHRDYETAGVIDLWIINASPNSKREQNLVFFQQMILNESMDFIIIYLDSTEEEITLVKKMSYFDAKNGKEINELFQRTYLLTEVIILPNGKIDSSFNDEYNKALNQFKFDNETKAIKITAISNDKKDIVELTPEEIALHSLYIYMEEKVTLPMNIGSIAFNKICKMVNTNDKRPFTKLLEIQKKYKNDNSHQNAVSICEEILKRSIDLQLKQTTDLRINLTTRD